MVKYLRQHTIVVVTLKRNHIMQLFLNSLPIKTGYAERDCSQDCPHHAHANPSLMDPNQSGTIGAKGAAYKISSHKYGIGSVGSLRHLLNTAALIA